MISTINLAREFIKIVHTEEHTPNTKLAGIEYIVADKPMTDAYLKTLVGGVGYHPMHISFSNNYYFPSGGSYNNQTSAGFALIANQDMKTLIGAKRVNSEVRGKAEAFMFQIIAESFTT